MCPVWVHRFAVVTAGATLVLIFVGALVTSTGSGLAVPDWPLSFGQVFPPMVGGVLFEHGHRLVAAFVGLLTVTLMVLLTQWEPRIWVRWLARGAVLAVVLQGALGGVTVLFRLPLAVSVTHACLAQAFLCLVVTLAVCTAPGWQTRPAGRVEQQQPALWVLATITAGMVYLQLILGALMRHMGAGLAIPDFPLAFGRLVPPLDASAVVVHFVHRLGALAVTLCVGWTLARVLSQYRAERRLLRPALLLGRAGAAATDAGSPHHLDSAHGVTDDGARGSGGSSASHECGDSAACRTTHRCACGCSWTRLPIWKG